MRPERCTVRLEEPVSAAGLSALHRLLGAVLAFASARFLLNGWVEDLLVRPAFHFRYFGFAWVPLLPGPLVHAAFVALFIAALAMVSGRWPRASALSFCLLFTYCELIDQTLYLNHYYLVTLLTAMLAVLPAPGRLRGDVTVPRWVYWALRLQVGVVYFYAGVAKLDADWLLRAEPLRTWLMTFADRPIIGPWLEHDATAYLFSWFGAAFDLSVPFWLCASRTRPWAYGVLVLFHVVIWLLFPVGIFSWVMVAAASIFFDPAWPQRWFGMVHERIAREPVRWAPCAIIAHLVLQVLVPLRHVLYPGDVNWTNEGFRFAWRVMLVEKTGQVEFLVQQGAHVERVYPERELTRLQYAQMSVQPDMIRQYAEHLAQRFASGDELVAVRADAWAQLNGGTVQRLIDPDIDLAAQPSSLWPAPWIVPLQPASSERVSP